MRRPSDTEPKTDSGFVERTATIVPALESPEAETLPDDWHIQVEVLGGPMDGTSARVYETVLTLGRSPKNDLHLPLDPMVSGKHARIVREGRHFWLEDVGSRNGTYLGDRRLEERALIGPGTNFRLGQTHIEFLPF